VRLGPLELGLGHWGSFFVLPRGGRGALLVLDL
jgi:hypothetical protein